MDRDYYEPTEKTIAILDRALAMIKEAPYRVSARWVFYRLLQEGYYSQKEEYKDKWIKVSSRARHAFYGGWHPNTMADETRERIVRGQGDESIKDWMESLDSGFICKLDKWLRQDNYVELWYEARAMTEQFRYYTNHITLVPMGGKPSLPYRWKIAKDLERAEEKYNLPIVILYFGDHDRAGKSISRVAEDTIRDWSSADFEFIHCGLTLEQVRRYNVPENLEKPGQYQWEALIDEGAREIITGSVNQYVHLDAFSQSKADEQEAEEFVEGYMSGISAAWRHEQNSK